MFARDASNAHVGTGAFARPARAKPGGSRPELVSYQNSHVTQIIPRRSNLNRVAKRIEQWVRVELVEHRADI